jgi:hypothetical protein
LRAQERNSVAEALIREFREEVEGSGLVEVGEPQEVDIIALAQHHGVPTRLLDWTDSPYVAAFFAFASSAQSMASENEVAIWALNTSFTDIWSAENGVQIVHASRKSNARLRNQEGRFTLSKTPFSCLEEYVDAFKNRRFSDDDESPLIQMIMPKTEALAALGDLDAMRIRYSTLFVDMTGAAENSKLRVMLRVKSCH